MVQLTEVTRGVGSLLLGPGEDHAGVPYIRVPVRDMASGASVRVSVPFEALELELDEPTVRQRLLDRLGDGKERPTFRFEDGETRSLSLLDATPGSDRIRVRLLTGGRS